MTRSFHDLVPTLVGIAVVMAIGASGAAAEPGLADVDEEDDPGLIDGRAQAPTGTRSMNGPPLRPSSTHSLVIDGEGIREGAPYIARPR